MTRTERPPFLHALVLLRMMAGLVVWSVHFLVVYCFEAAACALGFAGREVALGLAIVPFVTVVATAAALAACGLIIVLNLPLRRDGGARDMAYFIRWFTVGIAVTGIVGVILEAIPVAIIQSCR